MYMYNPYSSRVMSDWVYPFPLPNHQLSRRDLRSLRRLAKRDLPHLLSLRSEQLTPALKSLQASIQQGQNAVYEKGIEYASLIRDQLDAANTLLESASPELIETPCGAMPPDGVEYQLFVAALRRSQASAEAARHHNETFTRAQLALRKCEKDLQVVALLATRAHDDWTLFGTQLFERHYEFAFGLARMNPDLARATFSQFSPTKNLGMPELGSKAEPQKQLGPGPSCGPEAEPDSNQPNQPEE